MRRVATTLAICLSVFTVCGQNNLQDLKLYHDVYEPAAVLDDTYGVQGYDKLNVRLGGDSIRNCKGYACTGYVEDYYTNGQLLHKGYYVEGQLTSYKNYYPNGNTERSYRHIDLNKSKLTIFYSNGLKKSEVVYYGSNPIKWSDYYQNGTLEYEEAYNKTYEFYTKKNNYYEDGKPQSIMELDNKKKKIYIKTEYFPNGQVKMTGNIQFNPAVFDYQKIGKWVVYKEDGSITAEQMWRDGKMEKEKKM